LPKKYYDNNSSEKQKKIENISNYYKDISTLAKFKDVNKTVDNCMAVESKLAQISWTPERNHDIKNIHNTTTSSKLNEMMSNLNLDGYFKVMDYPKVENLNVYQPSYVEDLNKLVKEIPLEMWKDYLRVHLVFTFASMLSQDFEKAGIKYNISEGLNAKLEPLNVRGMEFVSAGLPMLFGKYYVATYFDKKYKSLIEDVVHNITDIYRESITNSKRLSSSTQKKALQKIDEMKFNIGYPNKWLDYSSVESKKDNLIYNILEIGAFEHKRVVKKLKEKVVDREEWGKPPQEINAYYDLQNNKFVLLAAILNEPFFDENGSDAVNYAGIGLIVGHEIGHAFDDSGSQFDEKGRLENWWTKEDYATFNLLKNKLIAQADQYEILPNIYANGKIEIGEIIADLSGSEIALKAYLKITDSKKVPRKEALQDFFIQIAKTWRTKYRKQAIIMHNDSDSHPIGEYRANGTIKNMDTFYEAFDIKKGDPMYIAPENRVHLWSTENKVENKTQLEKANDLLQKDLDKFGIFNLEVAKDYYAISELYFNMGKFNEAVDYGLHALKVEMKLKKNDDPTLAKMYFDIGYIYYMHKQHPTAVLYMMKAIEIYLNSKDKESLALADSYEGISSIYINLEDLSKSLFYIEKCLVIRQKKLDKNSEVLQRTFQNIEFLKKEQNK